MSELLRTIDSRKERENFPLVEGKSSDDERAKVFEEMEMILVIVFYAVENGILAQLFGLVLIKIYCEPESAVCAGSYVFWDTIFIIDRKTCRKWDFSVLL